MKTTAQKSVGWGTASSPVCCDVTFVIMMFSAVDVGVDMLEIDCHITKDGEVVVSHDEDLTRVTGRPVRISDTLYKVLFLFHCFDTFGWAASAGLLIYVGDHVTIQFLDC